MPVLSVAAAILAMQTFTVTRYAAGTYTEGGYVAGTTSTFSIKASVQPVKGQELMRLPEGERLRDYLAVYTDTQLRSLQDDKAPDRISIEGYTYEVVAVDDWMTEGGYVKALVARVNA
jgi:hypothetical protein